MPLTKKQRQVFDALVFLTRQGEQPTVREVASLVGLNSPASALKHLKNLETLGLIEMSGKSRGIRLLKGAGIPIVGQIAAGAPLEAADEVVDDDMRRFGFEELPVDPSVFGLSSGSGDLVALRIRGDSMINAGILDGDLVIVRRQPTVEAGEIAAVVVDGDGTLKRLSAGSHPASTHGMPSVQLIPENDQFEPIVINEEEGKDVRVYGKYVGLLRVPR